MGTFWSKFTFEAQAVVYYAQEEALAAGQSLVLPGDLLLGLLHEPESVVRRALVKCGIDPEELRKLFAHAPLDPKPEPSPHILLSPDAKRVFDVGHHEFVRMNSAQFREEHILLGLMLARENPVAEALALMGVSIDILRCQLLVMRSEAVPTKRPRG